MIRAFLKFIFTIMVVTVVYYMVQWQTLEPEYKARLVRLIEFTPVLLLSFMGTYIVFGVSALILTFVQSGSSEEPKTAPARPAAPRAKSHPLIPLTEKGKPT